MSKVVEVRVLDASRGPSLAPVPLQVHETQFAAVRPTKEASRREHRAHRVQVTPYCVDCWFGQMNDSSAAHLRLDDDRPAVANLDYLSLDAERACVEVDVTAL